MDYLYTAIATENNELYKLSRRDFDKILAPYPEIKNQVLEIANQHFDNLCKIMKCDYSSTKVGKRRNTEDEGPHEGGSSPLPEGGIDNGNPSTTKTDKSLEQSGITEETEIDQIDENPSSSVTNLSDY